MSATTADKYNFEIFELNSLTIRTASDEIVKPISETKSLNVELAGITVKKQFVVMNSLQKKQS